MLDKLFVKYNISKDVFTDGYTPEQAITGRKLINEGGKNLHVLFPPWHGGSKLYENLIKRLSASGDAVLAYYFHDEVLKPNTDQVKASFAYMQDTIAHELIDIVSKHKYHKVQLIAMSLGNSVLSAVSVKFHDFNSVVIVCSASSLARGVWYGTRTQHIRAGIETKGQDLAEVEKAWHELSLINHMNDLVGKDVRIVVSTNDEIAPSRYQMELVDAARALGINLQVQTTKLGHYAAIIRFCLYG